MAKPPISKEYFPVVTNRYEDFVAIHSNATGNLKADHYFHRRDLYLQVDQPAQMAFTASRFSFPGIGMALKLRAFRRS
jgi:hypothetical protein